MKNTAEKESLLYMYRLVIKKSAKKELDNIADHQFLKIDKAILGLRENPFPYPQSIKLKGEAKRRLRAGEYRVVYTVDESEKIVTIYHIRNRREVYR